jgi:hypothetical protein
MPKCCFTHSGRPPTLAAAELFLDASGLKVFFVILRYIGGPKAEAHRWSNAVQKGEIENSSLRKCCRAPDLLVSICISRCVTTFSYLLQLFRLPFKPCKDERYFLHRLLKLLPQCAVDVDAIDIPGGHREYSRPDLAQGLSICSCCSLLQQEAGHSPARCFIPARRGQRGATWGG